jgi:hypothetical protein
MSRMALLARRLRLFPLMAVLCVSPSLAQTNGVTPTVVTARPVSQFRVGSTETRFGGLEFVGGLELRSSNRDFGGMSAFRYLDAGKTFLGITDTGFWYAGDMQRDARGVPVAVTDFRLAPIQDAEGNAVEGKRNSDAEGMAVSGRTVTVSFERVHRIAEFDLDLKNFASRPKDLPLPVPKSELRNNRAFETVAYAPSASPLRGARVAVTEKSINKAGDIYAAVLEGPGKGIFYIKRLDSFDISDGDFLPNGDLLLLERRFSFASGVTLRIRRIAAADIKPGATVDGPFILEADMRDQIDNMEGLDVWQARDGSTRISMMSDDNTSILQRNLYLEFRLAE